MLAQTADMLPRLIITSLVSLLLISCNQVERTHDEIQTGDSSGIIAASDPCDLKLTKEGWAALRHLLTKDIFEREIVGRGNSLSKGAAAIRILFREVDRDAAFKCLVERGTAAGQLYGLCGVYYTDSAAFETLSVRFVNIDDTITMWWGCEYGPVRVGDVVVLDDGVQVGRTKSLAAWQREQEGDGWLIAYDISGGAIPSELRDGVFNTKQPGDWGY